MCVIGASLEKMACPLQEFACDASEVVGNFESGSTLFSVMKLARSHSRRPTSMQMVASAKDESMRYGARQ